MSRQFPVLYYAEKITHFESGGHRNLLLCHLVRTLPAKFIGQNLVYTIRSYRLSCLVSCFGYPRVFLPLVSRHLVSQTKRTLWGWLKGIELRHGLRFLKGLAHIFQVRRL